jgi:cytochrome c5
MTEKHADEHSSFIKTPKQLLIVVILAHVIPISLIVTLVMLTTGGMHSKGHPALSEEAVAKRIKPVGEVVVVDANAPKVERTGKQVVDAVCAACHATGALNAPKIGDKTAWTPLIKEGHAQLTEIAIKGERQMPPRGGNPDLTDTEVARAVAYMANQAGASFKEPESKPAAAAAAPAAPGVAPAGSKAAAPGAAAPSKTADAGKGKAIHDATCVACHGSGVAGAPKDGDKAAWAPRLKSGMDSLYASALKGKNAMPARGGNASLSDADVKAAVDYMAGLAR